MCLKYFVEHTTCEHYEYLGSQHCSDTPCDLDIQQFHYIGDTFPILWPQVSSTSSSTSDPGSLACETCVAERSIKLDTEEPIQYYPPTNDFNIEEIVPPGYALPIKVIRAQTEDMADCGYEYECEYDYKSLSDVDVEEWDMLDDQINCIVNSNVRYDTPSAQRQRAFIQEQVAWQLSNLPYHLAQQQQNLPFVPPKLTPEAHAMDVYLPSPMPYTACLAPSMALPISSWHGGLPVPSSSVHTTAVPPRPGDPTFLPMLLPTLSDAVRPTDPATLLQGLAMPATTTPTHSLPPQPPPFIVGSLTDAYLRIEAARGRQMLERIRRARSLPQDVLPAMSVSLADCIIQTRAQKKRRKEYDKATEAIEADVWSSLPFADELDAGGGAEEYAKDRGSVYTASSADRRH